jgi:hypothetical protein
MTFSEMRTLCWTWLSDPNGGYFTTSQVNLWLNNAQREVQKLVEQAFEGHFEKCSETTLVVNQREYQLPDDFKRVVRLEVVLSGSSFQNEQVQQLVKITPNQQDRLVRVGTPAAYYFKNNQLILVPAPDAAKTLRLTYTYRLGNMVNDNDESEIPEDYHELIPILATLDGLIQDGRDIAPMMAKKQHYEEMLKRDAEQRFIDAPRTVVQTDFDDHYEDL